MFTLCAVLSDPGGRAAFNQCTKVLVSSAAFCWYVGVQDESPLTACCAAPATTAQRVLCCAPSHTQRVLEVHGHL